MSSNTEVPFKHGGSEDAMKDNVSTVLASKSATYRLQPQPTQIDTNVAAPDSSQNVTPHQVMVPTLNSVPTLNTA